MTQPQVSLERIAPLRERLNRHPVYTAVTTSARLRVFMAHHIHSVWDFMSLLKYLQHHIAPDSQPWAPVGDPILRRFINDIVLEEESDLGLSNPDGSPSYASHFELYAQAMREVGADPAPAERLAALAAERGAEAALAAGPGIPPAARRFMESTFAFIASGQPHRVAAAFALGREHIIPPMFRALLREMAITQVDAPAFHYYLERHIHLDEDHHGPLSLHLLNSLCGGDPQRIAEAEAAAISAIEARITFWDGVLAALDGV